MCGSPISWAPLARHLDGFECIGVDLPGDPDMVGGGPVLTMRRFTALAVALLDELGIDCADVLGYSFGGMVAQQLALDAPARVGRLVLVSTSCGLGAMPSNPMTWWRAMLEDLLPPTYGPLWFPMQWCHTMRRQFGDDVASGLRPNESIQQFIAASGWSSLSWLARLPQQTLVITGTADALVPPENANILASRIPGARTYRVRGGGHLCLIDRVAETGPVVANFLRASEPAAVDQAVQLGGHAVGEL
jgi:pimeloyl-ACP methyl ester carboxylesterase